jgi:NAD(P)H-hydrate epimerase
MSQPITHELARSLVPPRPQDSHKGTYGYLLVVAGSVGLTGAAGLTCEAALRAGAGMVTLGLPRSLNASIEARLIETMTLPLAETPQQTLSQDAYEKISDVARQMHALAVGPGVSTNPETQMLVRRIAAEMNLPMVIDADGLNALAGHTGILSARERPTIVSPHPGEMARLTGISISEIGEKREKVAADSAAEWGVQLILKGAPSLVATTDGELFVNTTGNSGMSTAGSGDVLTGVLAALLCQGLGARDAAVLGTYVHGLAGDCASERFTERGMIAGDMISCLPEAWRRLA